MARKTRVYFVTDLHGSSKCFRKFINAGPVYGADVMVLGGDLAGKAIQSIVREPGGKYGCEFIGTKYQIENDEELERLEKLIADHGYYPYRAEPGELERRQHDGTLDELFLTLMRQRLEGWLNLAEERLRPSGRRLYFMLGNDDPPPLAELLDKAPWGEQDEGKSLWLDDDHEMISWGFSNITPWHSYREQSEPQLAASLDKLAAKLTRPESAIVNVHVPPYDTQLDDAPVLDENLQVQQVLGQVKMAPAGSTAVCDFLVARQPLLSLHGHIHEASGIRRIGRTIAINPGSDYSTGTLNGALITLEKDKVSAHQLVRG
jgi:Icc-related predicted phosphoesterase